MQSVLSSSRVSQEPLIMVVEDWVDDQERVELLLDGAGYSGRYFFAWNGWDECVPSVEEVLELALNQNVTCVLLDLAWSREDEDLAAQLRSARATPGAPQDAADRLGRFPISGLRFLDLCRSQRPTFGVIVATQYVDPLARIAMELGADHVYRKWEDAKPFVANVIALVQRRRGELP
jgi:CheY-like chemotaxis protein